MVLVVCYLSHVVVACALACRIDGDKRGFAWGAWCLVVSSHVGVGAKARLEQTRNETARTRGAPGRGYYYMSHVDVGVCGCMHCYFA